MPDFVKENGLEANEVVLQASKEAELSKSHFLNEQESERKTLYEQLQESKEKKQEEYERVIAARNSSYKLDEKSANFYEDLRQRDLERENKAKMAERVELEQYRVMKDKGKVKKSVHKSNEIVGSIGSKVKIVSRSKLTSKSIKKSTDEIRTMSEQKEQDEKSEQIDSQSKDKDKNLITSTKSDSSPSPSAPRQAAIPGLGGYSSSEED